MKLKIFIFNIIFISNLFALTDLETEFLNTAATGFLFEVKSYKSRGVDINIQDAEGRTALILAILNDRHLNVENLISDGAIPYIKDKSGRNAIHYAALLKNPKVASALLSYQDPLNQAILNNNTAYLKKVKNKVGTLNFSVIASQLKRVTTPLVIATAARRQNMVQLLLDLGANPNYLGADQYPALVYAVRNNLYNIAELLIGAGADVNVKIGGNLKSLLMTTKDIYMINLLIESGIDVNAQDNLCQTAIFEHIFLPKPAAVELLLKAGADLYIQDKNGDTPISYTRKYPDPSVTKLIENNINLLNNNKFRQLNSRLSNLSSMLHP